MHLASPLSWKEKNSAVEYVRVYATCCSSIFAKAGATTTDGDAGALALTSISSASSSIVTCSRHERRRGAVQSRR